MGWTSSYKEPGEKLTAYFIRNGVLSWTTTDKQPWRCEVLDGGLVSLHEYYAAVQRTHKDTGERSVFAVVILVRHCPKDSHRHNFWWKGMDEGAGPYATRCPRRILNLLTPTDNENALAWREACWTRIRERELRPKICSGMFLTYQGVRYQATHSLGRKGWSVCGVENGLTYRMKASQVAKAEIDHAPAQAA